MTLSPPQREVLAWQTLVELARRHPSLWILETHPGGGQYDCRTLFAPGKGTLVDFNLGGSVHPHQDGAIDGGWAELVVRGPFATARSLGKAVGLEVPSAVPLWNRRALAYAFIASALGYALAYDEADWTSESGYYDTSDYGGGVREELFAAFPRAPARLVEPHPHDLLGVTAYRFWFLLRGDKPVLAVETSGKVWTRDGLEVDLFVVGDPQASALQVVGTLLDESPSVRAPIAVQLRWGGSLSGRLVPLARLGHWTELPEDLSVSELNQLAHTLDGYGLSLQHLKEGAFAVGFRLRDWRLQSGAWQGSTIELLVAFFAVVRGWRGLMSGPEEGDIYHLEALGLWQAVRERLRLEPRDVVLLPIRKLSTMRTRMNVWRWRDATNGPDPEVDLDSFEE